MFALLGANRVQDFPEALPNSDKADFRWPASATGSPARLRVSGISVQEAGRGSIAGLRFAISRRVNPAKVSLWANIDLDLPGFRRLGGTFQRSQTRTVSNTVPSFRLPSTTTKPSRPADVVKQNWLPVLAAATAWYALYDGFGLV